MAILLVKDNARVNIAATPGRYGPLPISMFIPQVMASVIDFQNVKDDDVNGVQDPLFRMCITGDTMIFDEIKNIPKRYPDVDVALFHLGGTTVMVIVVTMDAKEGIEMFQIINPKKVIPKHYNEYDVFKSSLEEFQAAVKNAGLEDRVRYIQHGATYKFSLQTTFKGKTSSIAGQAA